MCVCVYVYIFNLNIISPFCPLFQDECRDSPCGLPPLAPLSLYINIYTYYIHMYILGCIYI